MSHNCDSHISNKKFDEYYVLDKPCLYMGDFWEIRKIKMKATGEKKTCKLFRKRDLC